MARRLFYFSSPAGAERAEFLLGWQKLARFKLLADLWRPTDR